MGLAGGWAMISLDAVLESVADRRSGWREWDSLAVLGAVVAVRGSSGVAWDFDAGEEWAHVRGEDGLGAVVTMSAPLVFLFEEFPRIAALLPEDRVSVVRSADPHLPELTASVDVVAKAFPHRPVSPVLEASGFSVLDFCFATD